MSRSEWQIETGGGTVSALYEAADPANGSSLFVAAHGAGGRMLDRAMTQVARTLLERGISILRFNFPYSEKGSGRPDPMPRLESTIEAVVAHAREHFSPVRLIIGGRSMGGRAASMLAAKGFRADGLLLLAYPLHPAGKPDQLRVAHLRDIHMPVLCFNGTRDPLCSPELMEKALETLGPNWRMQWLEGADHSFHVLKSSGRTDAEVMDDVGSATEEWLRTIDGRIALT